MKIKISPRVSVGSRALCKPAKLPKRKAPGVFDASIADSGLAPEEGDPAATANALDFT